MAFPTPTSSSSNNHNFDGLSSSSTGDFSAVPSPSNTSQNQYQQWLGGSSRKPQQFDALSSRPDLLSFHSLLEPDAGALRLDDVGSGGLIPIDSTYIDANTTTTTLPFAGTASEFSDETLTQTHFTTVSAPMHCASMNLPLVYANESHNATWFPENGNRCTTSFYSMDALPSSSSLPVTSEAAPRLPSQTDFDFLSPGTFSNNNIAQQSLGVAAVDDRTSSFSRDLTSRSLTKGRDQSVAHLLKLLDRARHGERLHSSEFKVLPLASCINNAVEAFEALTSGSNSRPMLDPVHDSPINMNPQLTNRPSEPQGPKRGTSNKRHHRVTKRSQNNARQSRSRNSRPKQSIRGWKTIRIAPSVYCQSLEIIREGRHRNSELSLEQKEHNRRKPWDPKKPYSCTFLCGITFKRFYNFERHQHEHQPQNFLVCDLPRIVRGPDGPRCSFCSHLDPGEEHFEEHHPGERACKEREVRAGTRIGRIFCRREHFEQHFKNKHKRLPYQAFEKAAFFAVQGNFDHICGFCGKYCSTWSKKNSHLGNHFRAQWTMDRWRDPWTGDELDFTDSSDDGGDDDDDSNDDDDDSNDDGNGNENTSDLGEDDMESDRDHQGNGDNQQHDRTQNASSRDAALFDGSRAGNSSWFLHFQSICGHVFSTNDVDRGRVTFTDVELIAKHLHRNYNSPLSTALVLDSGTHLPPSAVSAVFWSNDDSSYSFDALPLRDLKHERVLGIGSSGITYETRVHRYEKPFARKISLRKDIARFLKEAQTVQSLRHPHIIALQAVVFTRLDRSLMLSPSADCSLRGLIDSPDLLKAIRLCHFGCILSALQHEHSQGLVHLDIKPSNILVCKSESDLRLLLSDFGSTQEIKSPTNLEYTGKYVAPEVSFAQRLTTAADIYSLGLTIQEVFEARRRILPQLEGPTDEQWGMIASMTSALDGERPCIAKILEVIPPASCCQFNVTGHGEDLKAEHSHGMFSVAQGSDSNQADPPTQIAENNGSTSAWKASLNSASEASDSGYRSPNRTSSTVGAIETDSMARSPSTIASSRPSSPDSPSLSFGSPSSTMISECSSPDQKPIIGSMLLEPDEMVITQDTGECLAHRASLHRYTFSRCGFWFLNCDFVTDSESVWRTHCLAHFQGNKPPRKATCPFCSQEFVTPNTIHSYDTAAAWSQRMTCVYRHLRAGETFYGRPDYSLFKYLWQLHIIDINQYQELKQNYHLSHEVRLIVTYEGLEKQRAEHPKDRRGREQNTRRTGEAESCAPATNCSQDDEFCSLIAADP